MSDARDDAARPRTRDDERLELHTLADRVALEVSPQLAGWIRDCAFYGATYDEVREKLVTAMAAAEELRS